MKYVCNLVLFDESCGGYSVFSHDIEGAIVQGETLSDAVTMGENALAEILVAYEDYQAGRGEEMVNKICIDSLTDYDENGITIQIKVDTDEYRKNPSPDVELWYSPKTKKYYTFLADDNAEVKPIAEKMLREVSGVS